MHLPRTWAGPLAALTAFTAFSNTHGAPLAADTVLTHGKIYTVDPGHRVVAGLVENHRGETADGGEMA